MKVSSATRARLIQFRDSIQEDLLNNILPFWYRIETADGFHGGLGNDLKPVADSPISLVMVSRLLWTYSRAYRLFGNSQHIKFAGRTYAYLINHFEDADVGGYAWWLAPGGKVLDGKKQTYGQAFVVYALSEYYLATGNVQVLEKALKLFSLMERHSWNEQSSGYWEATDPEWGKLEDVRLSGKDMNAPLSMNTHLHVMEAYANLHCAISMDNVGFATERVLNVMISRILHPDGNRFRLFFDAEWHSLSDVISPGHDIEGSWLIWETAGFLEDESLLRQLRPTVLAMVDHVLEYGLDSDGSVFNEYETGHAKPGDKDWWPQAEGVVGFLNAFQMTGDLKYLEASMKTWGYIQEAIIDAENGEWFAGRQVNGKPQERNKAGPWKSNYHNGRMGFEVIKRVNEILNTENERSI